jgi:hypothetical protein
MIMKQGKLKCPGKNLSRFTINLTWNEQLSILGQIDLNHTKLYFVLHREQCASIRPVAGLLSELYSIPKHNVSKMLNLCYTL